MRCGLRKAAYEDQRARHDRTDGRLKVTGGAVYSAEHAVPRLGQAVRAPGEATGSFALESALDELAYALRVDPIQLRLQNYADGIPRKICHGPANRCTNATRGC